MALTTVSPGLLDSNAQYYSFKNRIINGAMVIDQRYAGAATANTINGYTLDRWAVNQSTTGKLIVQQSSVAPTGFSNSLSITSQSAYSVGASDYYIIVQYIEGFNFADMVWGTASAATITLSFWVRSSLTGTFGGGLKNSASNRTYPFTYTISAANTWEQKSVTITGDTTGTWVGATNGTGLIVQFGLGAGATFSGTAGAWTAGNLVSATGATSVVGTNGATFYITGVQLEKGSTATSFDYRPYGTELALCQRYYYQYASGNTDFQEIATRASLTAANMNIQVPVSMRSTPVAVLGSSPYGRVVGYDSTFAASVANVTGFAVASISSTNTLQIALTHGSMTAAAGLYGFSFDTLGVSAGIGLSAEL